MGYGFTNMSSTPKFTSAIPAISNILRSFFRVSGTAIFGHQGHGDQMAMDLNNSLGIAYLTNYISVHGHDDDPSYHDLEKEVYNSLDDCLKAE